MADVVARLDNVSTIYPGASRPALTDVSLSLERGEMVGMIGPTGAGKSTLCLTLNGIVPQFYGARFFGHATVAGLDTLAHPVHELARQVGMVFEDPETQLITTAVENEVAFALENLALPRAEIRERVAEALAMVRLDGMERRHPHDLSGGEKQRLAIAAALATRPKLLVLDEPTSQLDPAGRGAVFDTLTALNRALGVTILIVSHAAEEMAEHVHRVLLLAEGRLAASGTPREIYGDVERLRRYDLRPPQVTAVFHAVERMSQDVAQAGLPVRLDEGLRAVERWRGRPVCPGDSGAEESDGPPGEALIVADGLGHTYGDGTRALDGVQVEIRTGDYVLIAGQNGAGKTTLIKHFVGLLSASQGRVTVAGRDVREMSVADLARRIGYVAQNPDTQIFGASVEEEVGFALRNLGYADADVAERVERSLTTMGLLDARQAHPLALPRGDRARVVIAAVLAMDPDVIVLDEPTTGQDDRGARAILDVTRRLHSAGKTILVVTHHLHLMPEVAERMLVLTGGRVTLDAPLRQAYHSLDALRASFLEPPQAVHLARRLAEVTGRDLPLVTPAEVAGCLMGSAVGDGGP